MKSIRAAFERQVLRWPHVRARKVFGCPSYLVRDKLFSFLVTNGIVVTHLSPTDRDVLSRKRATTSFRAGARDVRKSVKVSVNDAEELDWIFPFVRRSYEASVRGT